MDNVRLKSPPPRSPAARGGGKAAVVLAAIVAAGIACERPISPGEHGTLRLAGRAPGEAPLHLLPPVSDRAGNVYVLYGATNIPSTIVYAAKNGGGWTSGCKLTKGDTFGAHGWVGFDEEHQWYWSGDALVSVAGRTGDCHRVLDTDPGTDANLLFRAVLPWVRDAPSRRSLVALVQSPIDPAPFSARVDLDAEILTNIRAFDPPDARDVKILGVGANREEGEGVVLLQFTREGSVYSEARYYDANAKLVAVSTIPLDATLEQYSVLGFLQPGPSGLYAGLLASGAVLTFDKGGGRATPVDRMAPVGVHKWGDELFLVGTASGHPVIARIDDRGQIGAVQRWDSSERAAANLQHPIDVNDDRSLPSTTTTFTSPRTAMGEFPFLHPHALTPHATGTTLWLVAGPSFDTGGAKITAFAMAPFGVSYP